MDSRNSKAELIAELKALRKRLEELERSGNKAPIMQPGSPGKAEKDEHAELLHMKSILAAVPHGVSQIDLVGNILYANAGYHKMFGYDEGELIGTSIIDRHENYANRKEVSDFIAMLVKDQPLPTPFFPKRLTKTGTEIDVQADFSYDRDREGNLVSITYMITDITERKQAEAALRESTALLDSYVTTAPVGMAIFDSEIRYVNVNETLAAMNGVSVENHLNKRPSDILPEPLGLAVEKKFKRTLRTDQPILHEEISGETSSQPGVTRYWLHSFFPIYGADREPWGVGVTIVEITEIKKAERQIRQSQKMEALGTLSGGIAHDFNNILYPIFIYANLLLEKFAADSAEYTDLKEITGAAQRAADLVSQILMFSRHSEEVKNVRDFTPIIEEAMKLMRAALPANITIEENIAAGTMPVFCDSSQLYQVVVNICTNAGQAISDGGKISIALDALEMPSTLCLDGTKIYGNYCRLSVTDNGVGMDDETLGKVFDPFFTTRAVGQGTGLGLSTVFGIIQSHEGGINITSNLDQGTTIEVYLPLAKGPIEELPVSEDIVQDFAGTEAILFVDDEKSIRKSARNCLERVGYQVTAVADGQEALDLFVKDLDHFDLVVTDQTMPNMTGEMLAHEIKRRRPGMPVILCTGNRATISDERSSAAGINAFLQKPLAPTRLMRVVREVLNLADIPL